MTFAVYAGTSIVSEILLEYDAGEHIQSLQTTQSAVHGCSITDPFLLAVMTNKRIRLHDLRTLPDILLSWELVFDCRLPDIMHFTLESDIVSDRNGEGTEMHTDVADIRVGRIVYGSRTSGNMYQALFRIGNPQMAMNMVPAETSRRRYRVSFGNLDKAKRQLPVVHTRFRQYLDIPYLFCSSLAEHDDDIHSRAVHLGRIARRLHALDPQQKRLLPLEEIRQWRELLRHSEDICGSGWIALAQTDDQIRGVLIRMNPVGDLIVQPMTTWSRERPRNARCPSASQWKVLQEEELDLNDGCDWGVADRRIDLSKFDLAIHIPSRRWDGVDWEDMAEAAKFRCGIPSYLLSSHIKHFIELSHPGVTPRRKQSLQRMARSSQKKTPCLPMNFHREHLQKDDSSEPFPVSESSKEFWTETDLDAILGRDTGTTLWTCVEDLKWKMISKMQGGDTHSPKNPDLEGGSERETETQTIAIEPWKSDARTFRLIQRKCCKMPEKRVRALASLICSNQPMLSASDEQKMKEVLQQRATASPGIRQSMVKPKPPSFISMDNLSDEEKDKWECRSEASNGADVVFLPVRTGERGEVEAGITFKAPCYQPFMEFPQTEGGEAGIQEMLNLWRHEWQDMHQGTMQEHTESDAA